MVGAGPSGTYSAYKLRNKGQTVELFEYSNRTGGRLFTAHLPNTPDINMEFGGMRYLQKTHRRFERLVKELSTFVFTFFSLFSLESLSSNFFS